jgi:hypothetical protein
MRAAAQGRGDGHGLAVPLALRVAARIQERDWGDVTCDPTQLANGLRDLVDACGPDGVPVSSPAALLADGPEPLDGEHGRAALEATRRLRSSFGDRLGLVAILPGPGALAGGTGTLLEVGKQFLAAGADALVVLDHHEQGAQLGTLVNVARFHQALAVGCCGLQGLPEVTRVPLADPRPVAGLVLTSEDLPADTDLSLLEDWVEGTRFS